MRFRRPQLWAATVAACLATASCTAGAGAGTRPAGPSAPLRSAAGGPAARLAAGFPASDADAAALRSVALWPKFAPPRTLIVADASRLSGPDLLTATTLEGVYNGEQHASRLYLIQNSPDRFWLTHLPSGLHTETLPTAASGPGLLRELLTRFRPAVKGAIVASPSNPDTVNLATTMAGLRDSVVIFPGQEGLTGSLGIKTRYRFDTPGFTADNPVQTYEWGIRHLLPQTSTRLEIALNGTSDGTIRDYAVAAKAFVYWLTSVNPVQNPLLAAITRHTPANTPVMGYPPQENPDVAAISSLGHFLTGSNTVTNESVWASLPSPPFLRQPSRPAPLRARPGTIYVGFLMSDGDNEGLLEQVLPALWHSPDFGAVPAGWTIAPGAVEFSPAMLEYYYRTLPRDSEFLAAPSGIGYISEETGPDLARFDQLTSEIMARDDLSAIDTYEPPSQLAAQASPGPGQPGVLSKNTPLLPRQAGSTFISGQTSGYIKAPESQYCAIREQAATERRGGAPLFLEPMIDAYHYGPADLLHFAQQLVLAGQAAGVRLVFTTPTELALTMRRYEQGRQAGLPDGNTQSVPGAALLARPLARPAYPAAPARITGPNLIANPSGADGTAGWTVNGGALTATSYQGRPALHWISHDAATQSWASYAPPVTVAKTYTFTADLAGTGQVFLNGYNGEADEDTLPVRLTSRYRRLTWTTTIPPGAAGHDQGFFAPQLQIRESGGPVSVYIANASAAESTPAC